MKYLLVLILVFSFSSCTNYDEKMRKFDASFTKMRKITSANVLNHELILGRPYIIHYADSSVVIYDDINDSIFTLIYDCFPILFNIIFNIILTAPSNAPE